MYSNDLEAGFQILWYQILSVLGRGGFGITYLAKDTNLGKLVAIKEYLPHDYATRSGDSTVQPASIEQKDVYAWGLDRFMSEAQTLAKFKHNNIVRVLSVFKHNNTGYMVMEYEEGRDLSDIYKEKKKLTQTELENIYYPIIDGLIAVHKVGFIHRDIKPSNIYIRKDGSPVLLDFGAARQAVGNKTHTLTAMLSVGYAPFEQYNDASGKQGPWTDIYAIGASLYQGVTGKKPLESTLRGMAQLHLEPDPYEPLSQSHIEGFSYAFLRAIDKSLMLQITDRPQTLEEFLGMLKGEITIPELPPKAPVSDPTALFGQTIIRPGNREFSGRDILQDENSIKTGLSDSQLEAKFSAEMKAAKKSRYKKIIALAASLVLLLSIGSLWLWPEKTPEQIKQQKIESILHKAEQFIAADNYYHRQQDSAFSRYSAVLAIEPDNKAALEGVRNVGEHYLREAEKYIEYQKFADAKSSIQIVSEINPYFPGLIEMQARLASSLDKQIKSREVFMFLTKAKEALDQHHAYEPEENSALSFYQKVLSLEPDNIDAKQGIVGISDEIFLDAQTALKNADYRQTDKLIGLAETIDPEKPGIRVLRNKLSAIEQLEGLIKKADLAYAKQQYTQPESGSAYDLYTQALKISPDNQQAKQMLNKIADYYAERTRSFIRAGNINSAENSLEMITTKFPDYSDIKKLKADILSKQNQQAELKALRAKQQQQEREKRIKSIQHLIPAGINQQQEDAQVVQDIVGAFLINFKKRDISALKQVAQINAPTEALYTNIFTVYKDISIKVTPGSFTLIKDKGYATVQFEIYALIDMTDHRVETTAAWTKINLNIRKKYGYWLKAEIKG